MQDIIYTFTDYINPATLPGAIVYAVVFLAAAFLASRLVHLLMRRSMSRASDPTGFRFIDQLLQVTVFIVVVILTHNWCRPCAPWAPHCWPV